MVLCLLEVCSSLHHQIGAICPPGPPPSCRFPPLLRIRERAGEAEPVKRLPKITYAWHFCPAFSCSIHLFKANTAMLPQPTGSQGTSLPVPAMFSGNGVEKQLRHVLFGNGEKYTMCVSYENICVPLHPSEFSFLVHLVTYISVTSSHILLIILKEHLPEINQ